MTASNTKTSGLVKTCCVSLALVMAGVTFVGCGDDAGPVFMEIAWKARRPNLLTAEDHTILGINGSMGYTLSCEVETSGDSRILSFTAQDQSADFSVGVRNAIFSASGGPATGASCQTTVFEGGNRYQGTCGAGEPSETQPCRLFDLTLNPGNDMEDPSVLGRLRCEGLKSPADQTLVIDLTGPGNGPDAEASPVSFQLTNCSGLI